MEHPDQSESYHSNFYILREFSALASLSQSLRILRTTKFVELASLATPSRFHPDDSIPSSRYHGFATMYIKYRADISAWNRAVDYFVFNALRLAWNRDAKGSLMAISL